MCVLKFAVHVRTQLDRSFRHRFHDVWLSLEVISGRVVECIAVIDVPRVRLPGVVLCNVNQSFWFIDVIMPSYRWRPSVVEW